VTAVEAGYSVRFSRLDEWALDAQAADAGAVLPHFLNEWLRPQLVILDLCRARNYADSWRTAETPRACR
jgi:hypothetical protein